MTKFCISLKTTDFLSKADLHLFFNHLWQEHLGTHIYDLLLLHSNTEQSEIILKQLHSLETFCHTLSNPNFRLKECQTDNSFKDLLISTDTQLTPCFLGFFKAYCPEFLSFILRSLQKNADILRAQNQAIDKTQRSNIQVTYLTLQKIINKLTDQLDNSVRKKPLLALPKRFQEEKGVGLNFFHRPVILLPIQKGSAKPSNQGLVSIQKKIEKSPNYSPSFELRQFFSPPPRILRPSTNYRRTPVPHGFR